jgi:hypothetical protein
MVFGYRQRACLRCGETWAAHLTPTKEVTGRLRRELNAQYCVSGPRS